MDLREAIAGRREYAREFEPYMVYFILRNPTSEENFEFNRRLQKYKIGYGKAELTREAHLATLWLLDRIKVRVEYTNGTPERMPFPDDIYAELSEQAKLSVVEEHLDKIRGQRVETQKN